MDMDQSAVFLAASVLIMMGFVAITVGIVAINNIIHRYWKPLGWFKSWEGSFIMPSARFAEPHELDKGREPKV
jgi:hypothetical protein